MQYRTRCALLLVSLALAAALGPVAQAEEGEQIGEPKYAPWATPTRRYVAALPQR